jgi:hypothetical protein
MTLRALLTIILVTTLSTQVLGQELNSKRKFNGILVGQEKFERASHSLEYRHKFKRESSDSTFYVLEFQNVESIQTGDKGTEMLKIKDQIFIGTSLSPSSEIKQFEKLMDFKVAVGESWTARNLFCANTSTITFELKYFDNLANDTIYRFKVDVAGLCSHTDPVKRIYGSKKLGLVRLDYQLLSDTFNSSEYEYAIFIADNYLSRRKLKALYEAGQIEH